MPSIARQLGFRQSDVGRKKIAKRVRKLERKTARELKATNVTITNNGPVDGTSSIIHLTPIAQGVTSLTRVGNWVTAKRMLANFLVYYSAVTVAVGAVLPQVFARVIIFVDKSYTNAIPTVAGVIGTDSVENIAPNFEQSDRIKILYDKIKPLSVGGGTGPNAIFRFRKRWRAGHKIHYNGAGATDYDSGNIYVMLMTDATAGIGFYAFTEVQYTDA